MKYFNRLKKSMEVLAEHPKTIFLGQATGVAGTSLRNTLVDIPPTKLLELPVFEETQMGMSIGLALNGFIPISIYPRWNFLILATNGIVNHLDKLEAMSHGDYKPGVIIRVGVGSETPLSPGPQHVGCFTEAFRSMLTTVKIYELKKASSIEYLYGEALKGAERGQSSIVVEWPDKYNEEA